MYGGFLELFAKQLSAGAGNTVDESDESKSKL